MIVSYNNLDEDVVVRHGVGVWNVFYTGEIDIVFGPVFASEAAAHIPGAVAACAFVAGGSEASTFSLGGSASAVFAIGGKESDIFVSGARGVN